MADDMQAFAGRLAKLNSLLTGGQLRQITQRTALKAKPVLIGGIEPNTLSHWGRGGKKGGYTVKARYDLISDHEATLSPTTVPLAALLEKGSGNVWKVPRRKGSPRRKKGTVGTYTRTPVPARHAWTKGFQVMAPKVPLYVDEEVVRVLGEVFG